MTFSAINQTEYTGVIQVDHRYLAVHCTMNKTICLSKSLEVDQKIAQEAAKTFATQNKLEYRQCLVNSKPFITIVQLQDMSWRPVELYPTKVVIIYDIFLGNFPLSKMGAANFALTQTLFDQKFEYLEKEFSIEEFVPVKAEALM